MGNHSIVWWVSRVLNDRPQYDIRRKTKEAVISALKHQGYVLREDPDDPDNLVWVDSEGEISYLNPVKVRVEYKDRMDLVDKLLGGGY